MGSRLDLVRDWEDRFRECGYKPGTVAKKSGVTLRFLETYFQVRFGVTPRAWIFKLRMREAERLLNEASAVKVVALELGYNSTGNFSRDFKRFHGANPREYLQGQNKPNGEANGDTPDFAF